MNTKRSWLVTATCLALPLAAVAQANSAETATLAPALRYESAFSDYKPWQDIQPGDWRALNEELRKTPAGQGAHTAAPAAGGTPTQPTRPVDGRQTPAADHGAHHMHGGAQ
ncbi:hypothetical protein ACPWT1_08640 [Ramlibacter sp. MMS24-I3-19]|uniref:hypothetical protein n=1 Tax=Ramlibacter sp. MMS24-I3-19 TaxID=3416606 RepID=UPI003CFFD934